MIHPTAIVSAQAELGANVRIGPFSVVGAGVVLHEEVELADHVSIEGPTEIGRGTIVYPFASLGRSPQDLKYAGEQTRLLIGARNQIREGVTMNRGTAQGGGCTAIGDDNLFMAQAHVAHDCQVGSHNVLANYAALAGHVEFGSHATIGAYSGLHQFCRAGDYSFTGACTKVVKDVLPYSRTDGAEAKCYGANTIGLRRNGFSTDAIRAIQHAFHLLLSAKLNTTQALERIKAEQNGVPEVDYLVHFIETSRRGVTK
jgi:UDP-N-acetylglucosamine acyltransferase